MKQEKHITWWKYLSIAERKKLLNTHNTKDVLDVDHTSIKQMYDVAHRTSTEDVATDWFNRLPPTYQAKLIESLSPLEFDSTLQAIVFLHNRALEFRVWSNVIKYL